MTESIKTSIYQSIDLALLDILTIQLKNLLCEKLIAHFSPNSAPKTSKIIGAKHFGQYSSRHRQIIVQSIHYVQLVHTIRGNPLFKFPFTWTIHAKSICFFVCILDAPSMYISICMIKKLKKDESTKIYFFIYPFFLSYLSNDTATGSWFS